MEDINWFINIGFSIVMAVLFVWDFMTFGKPSHKDFKAIIMSTGVLGTFVGIFVGLIGFDTLALEDSVPLLLNGLKTAFYTSILGMGLAIVLSIIQRARGVKSTQDMNMDYILNQVGNLGYLRQLESLNQGLLNLPTKADIQSVNNITNMLLEKNLFKINTSLQEAIKQLASGASKEIIGALELVIRDFNQNLQDQFGQNFSELNNAVGRLLTWQENYKRNVETTQNLLIEAYKNIQESANAMGHTRATLESVIEQNISAMEFYNKTLQLIDDMQMKGDMLHARLNEIATLGIQAQECLGNMNTFFTKATQNMALLQESAKQQLGKLEENVSAYFTHLDRYAQQNMKHLRTFVEQSSKVAQKHVGTILNTHAKGFSLQCSEFAKQSKELFEDIVQKANAHLMQLSGVLEENIKQNTQYSVQNAEEFARLREHIAKNHTSIVQSLESSLSYLNSHNEVLMEDIAKSMKEMQERYLTLLNENVDSMIFKEQEMIKGRLENLDELISKSESYANTQYKNVSGFLKKLANEYLKIMQKLTKNSVAIPKDMGVEVIKDFDSLQRNLLSHLGSLNTQIQRNSVHLVELYRNVQNIINENVEGNKALQEQIRGTFSTLDEQMSESMDNFKENYDWFLRRVREIIGSR